MTEECPSDCGMSSVMVYRECDTPREQNGGIPCSGENETTLACFNYCVGEYKVSIVLFIILVLCSSNLCHFLPHDEREYPTPAGALSG